MDASLLTRTVDIMPPEFVSKLAGEHRDWLSNFDRQFLINWHKLANNDLESALCEAGVRRLLQRYGATVEPGEDLNGAERRPDFMCKSGDHEFAVEVVSISVQKATEHTGLEHVPAGAANYKLLNNWIFRAAISKTPQCSNVSCPSLIAVSTFHWSAARSSFRRPIVDMLLTGRPKFGWNFDTKLGKAVGRPFTFTELESAVFLKPLPNGAIGFARSTVSGLLLCGLSHEPEIILGIRHPNPVHRFDCGQLNGIPFCDVCIDHSTGVLSPEWTEGSHDRIEML